MADGESNQVGSITVMDESIVRQIVDELISSLEPLETQSAALLQFVKDKGLASDETLAPYLEQAANASDVRWRAFRLRTLSLISSAMKTPDKEQKEKPKPREKEGSEQTSAPSQGDRHPTGEASQGTEAKASSSSEDAERARPKDQPEEQGQESQKSKTQGRKDAA